MTEVLFIAYEHEVFGKVMFAAMYKPETHCWVDLQERHLHITKSARPAKG